MELLLVFLGVALINNIILSHGLGVRPVIDQGKQLKLSLVMGLVVALVITLSTLVVFVIYNVILYPLNITYLYIILFVLVIVSLVQLVIVSLKKLSPALYQESGIQLPLVTANSAIIGFILLNVDQFGGSLGLTLVRSLGTGVGFTLVLVLFAGIWERIQHNQISDNFKGVPIAMIVMGLMAIVFFGFSGLMIN
jgi:electron transport complex protein RnfA